MTKTPLLTFRAGADGQKDVLGVGGFYNPDFAPVALTSVARTKGRINPVGTELASVMAWDGFADEATLTGNLLDCTYLHRIASINQSA